MSLLDSAFVCDNTISLSGTAVSGSCVDCDFVFDLSSEVTEDRSAADCEMNPLYSYVATDHLIHPRLGFASTAVLYGERGYEDYNDVLFAGFSADYRDAPGGSYYPGPYYWATTWDGPYLQLGWADTQDGTLSWGVSDDQDVIVWTHLQDCGDLVWSDATVPYGGEAVTGQVSCSIADIDGWGVWAEEGEQVWVTVDAPVVDTAFNPWFVVNDPSGCTILEAWNNYACSGTPGSLLMCASGSFTASQTGLYEIWVRSSGYECWDDMDGERKGYTLQFETSG